MTKQRPSNAIAWFLSALAAFGSWLIQLPDDLEWWLPLNFLRPHNLGALILAFTSSFVAGKFVNKKESVDEDE